MLGDERNRMCLGSQPRTELPQASPTPACTMPLRPGTEWDEQRGTDLSVTDCAESLQVVQGALSSSSEHRPDVVHLPEVPFPGGSDHFVKLQAEPRISTFVHTLRDCGFGIVRHVYTAESGKNTLGWVFIAFVCEQEKASRLAI